MAANLAPIAIDLAAALTTAAMCAIFAVQLTREEYRLPVRVFEVAVITAGMFAPTYLVGLASIAMGL